MSEQLSAEVTAELDRLGTTLASQRLSSPSTSLWAIALLTELAYVLRAVRAAGVMPVDTVKLLLSEATDVIFSEPEHPVQIVYGVFGSDKEGKPN